MLDENRIPNIDKVKIISNGRGLQIEFGNNTHFVDKRDLFNLPSWNDRKDNRNETAKKLDKNLGKKYLQMMKKEDLEKRKVTKK